MILKIIRTVLFQIGVLLILIIPWGIFNFFGQWYYISWLKIKFPSWSDLMIAVFTAQITICTLGITTLSFITSISKTQIYGVIVSSYILKIKPKFLYYEDSVISIIVCALYSLFFLIYGNIYSLFASFIITSILLIFWFARLANIFINPDSIELEVRKYVKDNFVECGAVSNNLFNELYFSIRTTNMQTIFYDLEFLKDILKKLVESNDNELNYSINNSIAEVINEMTDKRLYLELLGWLTGTYEILEEGNRKTTSKKYLQIDFSIYRMFRTLLLNNEFEIYKKSKELIEKIFYYENNHNKQMVVNIIYYFIISLISSEHLSSNQKDSLLDDMFNFLISFLISEYKTLQEICLAHFMKALIDKEEMAKLKKYYNKTIKRGSYKKVIIEICVYMYYLINEKESFKVNIKLIKDFLKSNVCIVAIDSYPFVNQDISYIWDIYNEIIADIKYWEKYEEFESKYMLMEYIIEDFFILSILAVPQYIPVENKILQYLDYYQLGNYFEEWVNADGILGKEFTKHCKEFAELFIKNVTIDVENLKSRLHNTLKQAVISKNNDIIPISFEKKRDEILSRVNNKFKKINIGGNPKKIPYIRKSLANVCSLKELDFSEYIDEMFILKLQSQVFKNIIECLKENLIFEKVNVVGKNKVNTFLSLLDTLKENACIDTMFKNKNIDMTLLEEESAIAKYNKVIKQIKVYDEYNTFPYLCVVLDSQKVNIRTGDFYVKFNELSEEEIINDYTKYVYETDKYLIRVYNNVACEFIRDEAIKHIQREKIMISFDSDLYIEVLDDTKVGAVLQIIQ